MAGKLLKSHCFFAFLHKNPFLNLSFFLKVKNSKIVEKKQINETIGWREKNKD
jgi:hypothetical protein